MEERINKWMGVCGLEGKWKSHKCGYNASVGGWSVEERAESVLQERKRNNHELLLRLFDKN